MKFGVLEENNSKEFQYGSIWEKEEVQGITRYIIAPDDNIVDDILEFAGAFPEPYGILYVLANPRSHEEGRYQSKGVMGYDGLVGFMNEYRDFFENDGRHHI